MIAAQSSNPAAAANVSPDMVNEIIAKQYLSTVKENRSAYGSYMDNAVTFAPNKETKSMYNVVYETQGDDWFPWGIYNYYLFKSKKLRKS
jgi:hypothetical protein